MSSTMFLVLAAVSFAFAAAVRVAVDDGRRDGKVMCKVSHTEASGATAAVLVSEENCEFQCNNMAKWQRNSAFRNAFTATPIADVTKQTFGRCACKTTADVKVTGVPAGQAGAISWELKAKKAGEEGCSPKVCWNAYMMRYDFRRLPQDALSTALSWTGDCQACADGSCPSFTLGNSVFYHMEQVAMDKNPTITSQKGDLKLKADDGAEVVVEKVAASNVVVKKVNEELDVVVEAQITDSDGKLAREDLTEDDLELVDSALDEHEAQVANTADVKEARANDKLTAVRLQKIAAEVVKETTILSNPWPGSMMKAIEEPVDHCGVTEQLKDLVGKSWGLEELQPLVETGTICKPECNKALESVLLLRDDGCAPEDSSCSQAMEMLAMAYAARALCRQQATKERTNALVQEIYADLDGVMAKCHVNKAQLIAFSENIEFSVDSRTLPEVCASGSACENELTNHPGLKNGCNDPRCMESYHMFATLYSARSLCRFLEKTATADERDTVSVKSTLAAHTSECGLSEDDVNTLDISLGSLEAGRDNPYFVRVCEPACLAAVKRNPPPVLEGECVNPECKTAFDLILKMHVAKFMCLQIS